MFFGRGADRSSRGAVTTLNRSTAMDQTPSSGFSARARSEKLKMSFLRAPSPRRQVARQRREGKQATIKKDTPT